ncbi:IPT/TIG domain-containing protein [Pontibacter sp. 13R65]|uniref:IPT/TIG domain-containing protein n=1 Tax=Pontibacter sp. 13R65 TaxID=3127458 RepID=UPI00301C2FF2
MTKNLPTLALYLLFICLCSCAKEKDFPSQNPYPLLQVISATADSTGIKVSAEVISTGTGAIKEYGIAYHPVSRAEKELKIPASALANNKFDIAITNQLIGQTSYEVRAYALVDDKTVYSDYVIAKSVLSSKPIITAFTPTAGASYSEVTITGNNFGEDRYKVEVYIGTRSVSVISHEVTKLVVRVPEGSYFGSYPIRVVVNEIEVITSQKFEIFGPYITGISKTEAEPGDTLTLFGRNFDKGNWPRVLHNDLYNVVFTVVSVTDFKLTLQVPFTIGYQYDKPYPISLTLGDKKATSPFNFTIRSNFDNVVLLPEKSIDSYMPAFEADGKGYFFDFNHVKSFDPGTNSWREESKFPGVARYNAIWQRVGDKGYLIGGYENWRIYGDAWEYDFRNGSWKKLPSLPFAVQNAASFVLDGKIYITGGENSRGSFTLWSYDPATQQVRELNRLQNRISYGSAFTRAGKAYVVSGKQILVYNPALDTWQLDSEFEGGKSYAFTIGNKESYLISGSPNPILYHYKSSTRTWQKAGTWPGCSQTYYTNLEFSGFATEKSLYLGSFTTISQVGKCQGMYIYTPK